MTFDPDDPSTWGGFQPTLIAHDVGRSRDRSTAVVGGLHPYAPGRVGITEHEELPQGLFGSQRASALAAVDRRHNCNALIIADLSNDESYAEPLFKTFGQRVIGVHITRYGDGQQVEERPVGGGRILVYTVSRNYLLQHLQAEMQSHRVRLIDGEASRRAFAQLADLEIELRDSGVVYTCPPGQHDDLAMSVAMLVWAARHPHLLQVWVKAVYPRRWPKKDKFGWGAFV